MGYSALVTHQAGYEAATAQLLRVLRHFDIRVPVLPVVEHGIDGVRLSITKDGLRLEHTFHSLGIKWWAGGMQALFIDRVGEALKDFVGNALMREDMEAVNG